MRVIPELVGTHRVVAPDLPAHGASGLPDGPLDADRVLAWLGELIERTCPSRRCWWGTCWAARSRPASRSRSRERLRGLVLVDTLGLARFRPAPKFALTMIGFQARPTERSYERFMRQCSLDLDGLRERMGERWEPFVAYNLESARGPNSKAVGRLLRAGRPAADPARRPGADHGADDLIWGRQDRANRLRIAEPASARYGWSLHVVEDCADDPPRDRPEAFIRALHEAIAQAR